MATVLSQLASAVYVLRFLRRKSIPVPLSWGRLASPVVKRVLLLGFTPFCIIALDNVMMIAMNAVLQRYGGPAQGDALVTCATVAQSFLLVVTMPLGGISGGTQTILAYNYGARQMDRVLKAQKLIFLLCVSYTTLLFLIAWLGGTAFVRLFTQDPVLAQQAYTSIKICTLAIIPLGIQYEIVDGFTALGQVRLSFSLSCWRKLVYLRPSLFSLPFLAPRRSFSQSLCRMSLGPLSPSCFTACL